MVAALVLAGTRPGGDPFAQAVGAAHKALIVIEGQTMLARVVEALRAAECAPVIVCCDEGPVADLARALGAEIVPPRSGPSGSVLAAFDQSGAPLLVTTADHALLRPEWVRELIDKAPGEADLAVMLAERARIEAAMPGSRRTYLRFADGHWSGCNLFLLRTPRARKAIETWAVVEADRKRPWKIVARLGLGNLLTYLLGRLSLADGLARLGRRFGAEIALVPASDGLAAVDVDSERDLADVTALLARRG
ncbi:cobalamin biosynthesis protein CobY [Altererythrobacter sp. B11]|uniref:nucleotidyltransferase family protein n=1 Tax=Altererythrobacter sp. B11 TaxID=2060312 RepID=UPI000DC6ED94|nr:nucleotidyltransferase family protein [Altererythrobacter sp. B11]BBC72988.1 cobalamin biosynthesis protein CobY [Altererythrobacter sp. B11]